VSSVIRLRTLGGLDLSDPDSGGELRSVLRQPKRLALLVYLALANSHRFRRRDTLTGLFWPEADGDHARGALRQALRFLRAELGPAVLVNRGEEEVGVNSEALSCDTALFEAACQASQWDSALELYRGDLLAGVFIADVSADFEHWLEDTRRSLRRQAASAAWSVVEAAERIGDLARAAVAARRAVELAPDDEASVRRLIRILDRKGDRVGALSVYEGFRLRLAAEYDAVPSPETEALLAAIRSRQVQIWESPLSGWPPPGTTA
jgi:DNA-binding SARP family transcriptional activator